MNYYCRALIEDVTTSSYSGLTGKFEWSEDPSGARVRLAPVVVLQWDNGTRRRLGAWTRAAGYLAARAPRWRLAGGRAPDDGAERCALQALADVLRADCRAAVLALAALLLAALLGASAAAACHCKRRAERKSRAAVRCREGLIKSCWQAEHKARPSAAEVAAFLADSPRLLAPCLDLPLDALPLDLEPWQTARERAEVGSAGGAAPGGRRRADAGVLQARWVSWAAPASAATDTTYLSADAPPADTDAFLA
ncbi:hypothetical protein HF086_001617 [Spodoptera exigua]|uniref:Uncharacterized protein n=1 Tax=Spodoptera exigua TaxID=7107 RepID=A0A922S9V8_SPOEX|nr:hypothetical protein HF086_001617 [Spodoptera exigua]